MLTVHLRRSARCWVLCSLVVSALACSSATGLAPPEPASRSADFVVTPRWAPDGRSLLVSARGGVGLSIIDLDSRALRTIDATHRGLASFAPEGDRVAFQSASETFGEYRVRPGQLRLSNHRPAYLVERTRSLQGELVAEAAGAQVYFDRYTGGVSRVSPQGTQLIHEAGAWGVQVAATGAVAFCTGHLPAATLHVWSPAGGDHTIGAGAQPAWFPDGSVLLYVVARWAPEGAVPEQSDLWAYDAATGVAQRLTATESVLEMEPAVSPDGARVAFADWGSGHILVADWQGLPR